MSGLGDAPRLCGLKSGRSASTIDSHSFVRVRDCLPFGTGSVRIKALAPIALGFISFCPLGLVLLPSGLYQHGTVLAHPRGLTAKSHMYLLPFSTI